MFINQKAQEITLALLQVASQVRRPELRSRIEDLGLVLLERAAAKEWDASLTTIDVLNALISFGVRIYHIEPINAKILIEELNSFNSAIRQISGLHNIELASIFSKQPVAIGTAALNNNGNFIEQEIKPNNDTDKDNQPQAVGVFNANIRQSAILDKIRQSGKATMKELIAQFPGVSERTLRYDLQKLCTQQFLDRVGNGGPATYYVPRNKPIDSSL